MFLKWLKNFILVVRVLQWVFGGDLLDNLGNNQYSIEKYW